MKSIIFIPAILLILSSACKKKEETPAPVVKTGSLYIKYYTADTSQNSKMRINYTINNSIYESKDVNGPYFVYEGTANSGSELLGSLIEPQGHNREVWVVFNSDTVFHKIAKTDISFRFNLPTL